ncbi:DUF2726 domain-containing protein [Candidatus Nomurabacteria bacterium]|nr:DUF2726 domain-containing protein [Candidatus Nomurabacteria bacterium]
MITKIIFFITFVSIAVFIVSLLKIPKEKSFQKLPYKKRSIMTEAELNFFRQLEQKYGSKYYIIPQVLLSSIVDVDLPKSFFAYRGYRSKIDKKTIDFVMFDKQTYNPFLVIELDDSSHLRADRQIRDHFLDEVFNKTEIKIVHIKTAFNYDLNEISAKLES